MSTKFAMPPLTDALPAGSFEVRPTRDDIPTIVVPAGELEGVARALRDHPALAFNVCLDVTAADRFPRVPRFDVVYHFVATDVPFTLRMKVLVGDGSELPTLASVWPSANWQEREVWDLFGIVFTGHPTLERLLTPEDWEGHPLRKDYPVQVSLPVRTYEPMQLTEEEFRANVEADRRHRRPE
jgi:NADH-quinone oxidoreductase subunit C